MVVGRLLVPAAILLLGGWYAAAAQETGGTIHVAARIACQKWPTLERIFRAAGAGAEAAANKMFRTAARRGGCIRLHAGDRVYVTEFGLTRHRVKLRPYDRSVEFWAVALGDRRYHVRELVVVE